MICGVDVSSETLDARIGLCGPVMQVKRTPQGIAQLRSFCTDQGVELVVMEATGGYERLPFAVLWAGGLACAIANPRSVRRYAEALGFLEKTDRIDAGVIADYGRTKRLVGQPPASRSQEQLRALVTRLRQLTALKVMQLNQRRLIEEEEAKASIDELLAVIRKQTKAFELKIAALLKDDPLWQALDQAFREIKGVADRTVANLLAEMPEIGTISDKAIAKLAGLAPMAKDSGRRSGKRSIQYGRAPIRSILFIVAAVVQRHEPDFAAFHARLIKAGKPKRVARIALARKLLVRLNAKARDARKALLPA